MQSKEACMEELLLPLRGHIILLCVTKYKREGTNNETYVAVEGLMMGSEAEHHTYVAVRAMN